MNIEDITETDYDPIRDMTPAGAVHQAILDLYQERRNWQDREDEDNVREWLDARISCLEQAHRDLTDLRAIKKALAVLKGII